MTRAPTPPAPGATCATRRPPQPAPIDPRRHRGGPSRRTTRPHGDHLRGRRRSRHRHPLPALPRPRRPAEPPDPPFLRAGSRQRPGRRTPRHGPPADSLRLFIDAAISQRNELVLPLHGGPAPPRRRPRPSAIEVHEIVPRIIDHDVIDATFASVAPTSSFSAPCSLNRDPPTQNGTPPAVACSPASLRGLRPAPDRSRAKSGRPPSKPVEGRRRAACRPAAGDRCKGRAEDRRGTICPSSAARAPLMSMPLTAWTDRSTGAECRYDQGRGAVANATAPGLGTGIGVLVSSFAVQWLPAATRLVYLPSHRGRLGRAGFGPLPAP